MLLKKVSIGSIERQNVTGRMIAMSIRKLKVGQALEIRTDNPRVAFAAVGSGIRHHGLFGKLVVHARGNLIYIKKNGSCRVPDGMRVGRKRGRD